MSRRAADLSAEYVMAASPESSLSPCETYEGSLRFTAIVAHDVVVEGANPATNETVVMSPALLEELREELRQQALKDPPHVRPTQRSMPAARPEEHSGHE